MEKDFLNICISRIDGLHIKKPLVDLSAIFNLNKRALNKYITVIGVHEIKFPEAQVEKGPSWEKKEGGNLQTHANVIGNHI